LADLSGLLPIRQTGVSTSDGVIIMKALLAKFQLLKRRSCGTSYSVTPASGNRQQSSEAGTLQPLTSSAAVFLVPYN